jgi:MoaA/NifB/PqqE/SkfB family radical SAM enzyme
MAEFDINPGFQYIFVHLTNRCNLSCSHCYVNSSPTGEFGLSKGVVKSIIDDTAKLPNNPVFVLSGGEPFSRRDDCLEILDYASTRVNTKLFTNGTLFNTNICRQLSLLQPAIRISIDGNNSTRNDEIRGNGSFVKTLKGIALLFSSGFPKSKLSICATLVDFDEDIIGGFLILAQDIGVESIRFNALCRRGRGNTLALNTYGEENEHDIFQNKQSFYSTFSVPGKPGWAFDNIDEQTSIFSTINIYSDGSVFPYIPHDHLHPRPYEICAGNVNDAPLSDIIQSSNMRQSILKKFIAHSMSKKSFSRAYHAKFLNS